MHLSGFTWFFLTTESFTVHVSMNMTLSETTKKEKPNLLGSVVFINSFIIIVIIVRITEDLRPIQGTQDTHFDAMDSIQYKHWQTQLMWLLALETF